MPDILMTAPYTHSMDIPLVLGSSLIGPNAGATVTMSMYCWKSWENTVANDISVALAFSTFKMFETEVDRYIIQQIAESVGIDAYTTSYTVQEVLEEIIYAI